MNDHEGLKRCDQELLMYSLFQQREPTGRRADWPVPKRTLIAGRAPQDNAGTNTEDASEGAVDWGVIDRDSGHEPTVARPGFMNGHA